MSTPPASIAALIVSAGFVIATGVAILYNYLIIADTEEEPRGFERNQSPSDQRQLTHPIPRRTSPSASRRRRSSPERPRLRAISPPRQSTARSPAPSTSQRRNRVPTWQDGIPYCLICRDLMPDSRIELECSHTFHDNCYTIWRHMVVMRNPHAKLCPSC